MTESLIELGRNRGWTGVAFGSFATMALSMAVVAQAQDGPSIAPSVTLNLGDLRTDRSSTVANDLARSAGATRLVDEFGHSTLIIRGNPVKLEAALRDLLARQRIEPIELENLATPSFNLQDLAAGRGLRRPELEQTVGPAVQVQILIAMKETRYASCSTPECRRRVDGQLTGLAPALAELSTQPPACDTASAAYSQAALAQSMAGRVRVRRLTPAFDAACMVAPWDPEPTNGSQRIRSAEALLATALFQVNGSGRPFCGGAFLAPRKALTALHCFSDPQTFDALTAGHVTVRQAGDPSGSAWRVKPPALDPALRGRAKIPVGEDAIDLELEGAGPAVPAVTKRPVIGIEPAFVAGYLNFHDEARRPGSVDAAAWATRPEWWRGIRWARPGSCHAFDAQTNCFRMLCQTVPGFSGSAVFASNADPAGGLVLLGLVKGADGEANACLQPPLSMATVGVIR